jgi:uncharacterized protein (DUF2384 family)
MQDHYDELGQEWRKIGLTSPAVRALVDARLFKVSDLRKISLDELTSMHGMGKSDQVQALGLPQKSLQPRNSNATNEQCSFITSVLVFP